MGGEFIHPVPLPFKGAYQPIMTHDPFGRRALKVTAEECDG